MYLIKVEMVDSLRAGRTARYIAEQLNVTESFISTIFNGKKKCTKLLAMGIISIKHNISLNNDEMEDLLKQYFIKT